jgi:hypothetical protein
MATQSVAHSLYISAEVKAELDNPEFPQRDAAILFVATIPMLAITPEILGLAAILIRELVMPGPVAGEAIHVATCCIHKMDYLLSWNVRHLANPNKLAHLQTICLRVGHIAPRIITPDLLWEKST